MGHGVAVQDVLYNSSFDIAWSRIWAHLVGSDILRFFTCWQIPVPLLIEEPTAKYLPVHYCRFLTTCVTKLHVLAMLASTGSIPRNTDEY